MSAPSDWEKHVSKRSGKIYWFNRLTGETKWRPPATMTAKQEVPTAAAANATSSWILPSKTSSLHKREQVIDSKGNGGGDGKGGSPWNQHVSKKTGRPYWFNRE